jgi:hypothetical protein
MKLKEIISAINTALQTALNQEKFQKGKFYGLAKLVRIKDKDDTTSTLSIIYDSLGNELDVSVDDTYPFSIYHRCVNITQSVSFLESFGDENAYKETSNMVAIVFAKQSAMITCQEDIASIVTSQFPNELIISDINKTLVRVTGINNDSYAVFQNEYKSTDYPLNPQDYYFSINYIIETTYTKSCVDKCLC